MAYFAFIALTNRLDSLTAAYDFLQCFFCPKCVEFEEVHVVGLVMDYVTGVCLKLLC